jgi:hypothetical protein
MTAEVTWFDDDDLDAQVRQISNTQADGTMAAAAGDYPALPVLSVDDDDDDDDEFAFDDGGALGALSAPAEPGDDDDDAHALAAEDDATDYNRDFVSDDDDDDDGVEPPPPAVDEDDDDVAPPTPDDVPVIVLPGAMRLPIAPTRRGTPLLPSRRQPQQPPSRQQQQQPPIRRAGRPAASSPQYANLPARSNGASSAAPPPVAARRQVAGRPGPTPFRRGAPVLVVSDRPAKQPPVTAAATTTTTAAVPIPARQQQPSSPAAARSPTTIGTAFAQPLVLQPPLPTAPAVATSPPAVSPLSLPQLPMQPNVAAPQPQPQPVAAVATAAAAAAAAPTTVVSDRAPPLQSRTPTITTPIVLAAPAATQSVAPPVPIAPAAAAVAAVAAPASPVGPPPTLAPRQASSNESVSLGPPVAEGAIQRLLVVGYAKRHEGRPDEHIVYNLRVLRPGVEEQELFKRFSEFAELHERAVVTTNQHNAAMTAMPATASADERRFLPLPRMPSKLLVGANDRSVLQERVVGLQAFMEQLLSAQPPIFLPLLEDFVRTDDVKSKGNFLGTLRRQKSNTVNANRSSMRTVRGLDSREIDNLALFLKTREESEPSFIGQLMVQNKKSKKANQQKLLVVTVNRIYVMRAGCDKAEFEGHLRDIKSITSLAESTIEIDFGTGIVVAGELDAMDCTAAICEIRIAEDILFPGRERAQKIVLTIEPKTRLRQLRPTVCGPCGGFVVAFRSMLNYLSTPYGIVEQEIAYLVDNVLDFSNQFYFDFQQFNLQNADGEAVGGSTTVQAIMLALVHNLYFRGLIVENYRFDKETFAALAQVMASNGCFDTLLLDGVNQLPSGKAAGDGISVILQALSKNPRLRGLSSIDLSNNISFGRAGASHLSEFLAVAQQLRYLNLSNNGLGAGEVALLCDRIAGNALSFGEHLVLLDLSLNTVAATDRSLPAALRALRSLRHLNLSGALEYKNGDTCMPELLASLPLAIELLDLSKNVIRRPDAQPFETALRRCTQLQELNLSECPKLDPAVVCAVVTNFGGNVILRNNGIGPPLCDALAQCGPQWTVRSLDLSDNPLFVAGFVRICEGAARSAPLQQLRVSSVFQNAKEDKGAAISMLLRLLARKVTPLVSLHMAGTNYPLGTTMLPLLAALGQNKTLADLDLRDHLIGNRGATLLAQALQTNASLVSLAYDGNQTAPSGFQRARLRAEAQRVAAPLADAVQGRVVLAAHRDSQDQAVRGAHQAPRRAARRCTEYSGDAAAQRARGRALAVRRRPRRRRRRRGGRRRAGRRRYRRQGAGRGAVWLGARRSAQRADRVLARRHHSRQEAAAGARRPPPRRRRRRRATSSSPTRRCGAPPTRSAPWRRARSRSSSRRRRRCSWRASGGRRSRSASCRRRRRRPSSACFGRPLQQAMRVQEDNQMALPTFLAEILACIEKLHLRVPALLTTLRNADRNRVESLKRDIDGGAPSEWLTVPVGVLLSLVALWLQSLPEPAFTFGLLSEWVAILSVENNNDVNAQSEAATRVVRRMPPANQVLVRALFQFFRKLRSQADVNGADATAIGRVFAPLLLRDPRSGGAPVTSGVELVAFLIESFEMVFSDESEALSSDLINATLRAINDSDRLPGVPAYAAVPYIGSSGAPVDTMSRRTERMSLMWVNADEDQLSMQVAGEGGF